jgi:phasin
MFWGKFSLGLWPRYHPEIIEGANDRQPGAGRPEAIARTREESVMADIAVNAKSESRSIPTTGSPSNSTEPPLSTNSMSEFPILLRGLSEQNSERAKESWKTMKSAGEKLTAMVQGTYSTAAKESMDYGLKVMETASLNAQSAFELASALAKAKTPSEVVEISGAHARKQMELLVTQNRQLWAAAQKIATSMFTPVKDGRDA